MSYWLLKSEPDDISVDDLGREPNQTMCWSGIRNYQARNFIRDGMRVGDQAFFYHSSCAEPGIAGIVEMVSGAYPDPTQFDARSRYHDAKATPETPRWVSVDIHLLRKTALLPLKILRTFPELEAMPLLARGNRLSVSPVAPDQWAFIIARLDGK